MNRESSTSSATRRTSFVSFASFTSFTSFASFAGYDNALHSNRCQRLEDVENILGFDDLTEIRTAHQDRHDGIRCAVRFWPIGLLLKRCVVLTARCDRLQENFQLGLERRYGRLQLTEPNRPHI